MSFDLKVTPEPNDIILKRLKHFQPNRTKEDKHCFHDTISNVKKAIFWELFATSKLNVENRALYNTSQLYRAIRAQQIELKRILQEEI